MPTEQQAEPARTLLVDDVEGIRDLIGSTLRDSRSFRVVGEAANGEQAIEKARKLQPDLVLLDLSMPRMDGLEALPEIRREVPGVTVIVLSGFKSDRMENLVLDLGAAAYVEKGADPERLLAELRTHIGDGATAKAVDPQAPTPSIDARDEPRPETVLVLSLDGGPADELSEILDAGSGARVVRRVDTVRAAKELEIDPDVVLLAAPETPARWRAALSVLRDRFIDATTLLVVPDASDDVLDEVLELGAGGCLRTADLTPETLSRRLRTAQHVHRRHREHVRRLENLAGAMAHDLKHPLRVIRNYARWVEEGLGDGDLDRVEDALEGIDRGLERADRLVESLLTLARLQVRRPTDGASDAQDALEEAIEDLGPMIQASGARIDAGPLPEVLVQHDHLVILFRNLLSNAIKYREPGTQPRIEVSAEHAADHVRVDVTDDGIGIEAEHHDQVFEPFARLHAEADIPGTGLGLAICQEVVEQHGGRLTLTSVPGEGTTFHVYLPNDSQAR